MTNQMTVTWLFQMTITIGFPHWTISSRTTSTSSTSFGASTASSLAVYLKLSPTSIVFLPHLQTLCIVSSLFRYFLKSIRMLRHQ